MNHLYRPNPKVTVTNLHLKQLFRSKFSVFFILPPRSAFTLTYIPSGTILTPCGKRSVNMPFRGRVPYTGKRKFQKKTFAGARRNVGMMGLSGGREKKYFEAIQQANGLRPDIPRTGIVLPSSDSLVLVPQGSGANQRDGRKIQLANIRIRGTLRASDVANNLGPEIIRIILVQDTQCNGTVPTADLLLDNFIIPTAANANGPTRVTSFMELANQQRFRILKDKIVTLTSQDPTLEAFKYWKMNVKFNKAVAINFNGATPDITNVRDNNFFLLFIKDGHGSVTGANDATIEVDFLSRIRYWDT